MAIKTYGKYTGYLTDPWTGQKVPYDERYPQQKEQLMRKHREAEATLGPMRKAKAYYEPGGGYGKGVEAGLERERTQAMSSGMQALIASGFAGTTMAGGLGKKFAEEVGMPTRARLEETRGQAISGIEMILAEMAQQKGQASTQMRFQAGQSKMDRELQRYLANLQINQRTGPTMTATSPQTQPQRRSTTSTGGGLPSMTGAGAATYGIGGDMDVGVPTQGFWGASEQWRSEQPDWVTGADELNVQGSNFIWGRQG